MSEDDGAYRFLSGAGMEPGEVLTRFPGARFVARARMAEGGGDEIWGILIRLAEGQPTAGGGETRPVVTDDGRRFVAATEGDGRPIGEPAAVLAAARYWELPPAYIRRLAGGSGEDAGR